MIDYTKLREKLIPTPDGQDVLRLRVGVVDAIDTDGTVDLELTGIVIGNVPVLSGVLLSVGMVVQVLSYRGSLLVIGGSNTAMAEPAEASGSTTNGGVNVTSFTNTLSTTGIHGVAFIAAPSGQAFLIGRAIGLHGAAGGITYLDWEIREGDVVGSGAVHRASNNNTASLHTSAAVNGQGTLSISGRITGMTPGNPYNACLTYRIDAVGPPSGAFNRRYIAVYPI